MTYATFKEWFHSVGHRIDVDRSDAMKIWEVATLAERERIAKMFDKEAARQEKIWNKFLAEKNNKHGTSFHSVFLAIADKIRSGKP